MGTITSRPRRRQFGRLSALACAEMAVVTLGLGAVAGASTLHTVSGRGAQPSPAATMAHSTFNCDLRSRENGRFVSAELTYTGAQKGVLRARAGEIAAFEQYQCVAIGTDQWAIRSRANGRYVSAELTYPGAQNGTLRARATAIGPWETFTFGSVPSCSCVDVKAANAKFVSAALDESGSNHGILRARASSAGLREEFSITRDLDFSANPTAVSLQAPSGGYAYYEVSVTNRAGNLVIENPGDFDNETFWNTQGGTCWQKYEVFGTPIPPYTSCTIEVGFHSASAGTFTGTMTVHRCTAWSFIGSTNSILCTTLGDSKPVNLRGSAK